MTTIPLYQSPDGSHGGYCALIEIWGSDQGIIEAARMSTDGAFRGWGTPEAPGDEKLLAYLWKNHHHTPFEMAGAHVEIAVPIFVLRQVHRHRAASYNELSGRYVQLPDRFWLPRAGDIRRQGGSNRQGSLSDDSGAWSVASEQAVLTMVSAYEVARRAYEELLALGVAREQARSVLPVAQYTRCRMQCNLRMWMHFLGLRQDGHAQAEIRVLADAIAQHLRSAFPRTLALFDAHTVSKPVVG